MPNDEVCLTTNIKLKRALFDVHTVIVRYQLEQEFSFRFESIIQGHYVYKGALTKYFDNRIKLVPNTAYVLISEMRLITLEYSTYHYSSYSLC